MTEKIEKKHKVSGVFMPDDIHGPMDKILVELTSQAIDTKDEHSRKYILLLRDMIDVIHKNLQAEMESGESTDTYKVIKMSMYAYASALISLVGPRIKKGMEVRTGETMSEMFKELIDRSFTAFSIERETRGMD